MSESFAKRLRTLERARPSLYRQKRFGEVMEALQRLLADACSVDQRISVRSRLLTHYRFIGDDAAALRTIDEQIGEKADDVVSLIDLTEHFHYYQVDLLKAAESVERALAMATDQSLLVRQVLGVRNAHSAGDEQFRHCSRFSRATDRVQVAGALGGRCLRS